MDRKYTHAYSSYPGKKKQKERNEKMEVDLRYLVYLEKIPLILLWS
jgi:hypothetical protein